MPPDGRSGIGGEGEKALASPVESAEAKRVPPESTRGTLNASSAFKSPAKRNPLFGKKAPTRVFIVHGHDEAAREGIARFVERMGFEAIILHELPNRGRTIIEKFESHSETAEFAIVLLTPDDIGGARGTRLDRLQHRARQNVVAELFFFIGKLGRSRVYPLKKGKIELPSDLAGVVYEEMDEAGHWRLKLAQEMREAGLPIDFNKIFK